MYIKNTREYQAIFEKVLDMVIDDITDWLLEKLRKQIKKDVYTKPNSWYAYGSGKPTYEFYNAWKWSAKKQQLGGLVTELFFDRSTLTVDEDNWVHGSPIWGSARDTIEDILNLAWNDYKAGYTSDLRIFGMAGARHLSHPRRPYWNNFIEEWIESGKLDKRIETALRRGLGSQVKIIITGRKAGA